MPDRPNNEFSESESMGANLGDSLDREMTQNHSQMDADSSQIDSLDGGRTLGASGASSVDISQFDEGWEQSDETTGLETRYSIEERIGQGGMGDVFRGRDNRLKRPVAIKRLKGELSRNRRAVERFSREAEAVARLNHYNIVQIHDVGQDELGHYIVMELVEGDSLSARLNSAGALSPTVAIDLAAQLCDALTYAHEQGIVHRDIKPANILLAEKDIPKLTDFGLARFESGDRGQTKAGAVLGTLDFMPPEQHRDASRADARSDQWALAATFYQMATGESPRVIRPERLPESMRAAVLQALEENPEKRFADCRAFRDALLQSQVSAENSVRRLTPGQCGNCQHINDVKKTFCEACGENLLQPCPGCNEKVGVWVTFCGECGADLAKELDTKRIALFQQQKDIESLRRRYRHADAIRQLEEIIGLDHPAFETHRTWASQKLSEYRAEFAGLEKQRDEILALVRERIQTHDLDNALPLLDRVPKPLANSEVAALREELSVRIEEIQSLGKQIRLAVASKQLEGLISKVEKFLDLRPSDEKAKKLLSQLRKRAAKQATHTAAVAATHDGRPQLDRSTPDPGIVLLNDAASKREFPNLDAVVADSHAMARPVNTHKLSQQRKTRRLQGIMLGSVILIVLLLLGMQWWGDRSTSDNADLRPAAISESSGQPTPTESAPRNPSAEVDERDQISSLANSSEGTVSSDGAAAGNNTNSSKHADSSTRAVPSSMTTSGTPASKSASDSTDEPSQSEPATSTATTEAGNAPQAQTGRPAESPENENDPQSADMNASPVNKNLAGTSWSVADSNGDHYVFYFQTNGILHYEAGRGMRENASWKWLGSKLTLRINNDFAHFSGTAEKGKLAGSGFSKNGAEWSWTASRIAP